MLNKKFNGAVIVITGGASDIGKGLIKELIPCKPKIVIVDINERGLIEIVRDNSFMTLHIEYEVGDMTDPFVVKSIFSNIKEREGKIDYVFNIAGYALVGEVVNMKFEDWNSIIRTNLNGILNPTICAYEIMTRQGCGHIVNMSSLGGIVPSPYNTAYSTTKSGIVGLSTSLREEGRAYGVNISVICAGGIQTKLWTTAKLLNIRRDKFNSLIPPKSLMTPQKAAEVILKQVGRNKAVIVFPMFAKISYFMYKFCPSIYNAIGSKMVIKNLGSAKEVS
jgi:short-subunit dehydrogenase